MDFGLHAEGGAHARPFLPVALLAGGMYGFYGCSGALMRRHAAGIRWALGIMGGMRCGLVVVDGVGVCVYVERMNRPK